MPCRRTLLTFISAEGVTDDDTALMLFNPVVVFDRLSVHQPVDGGFRYPVGATVQSKYPRVWVQLRRGDVVEVRSLEDIHVVRLQIYSR